MQHRISEFIRDVSNNIKDISDVQDIINKFRDVIQENINEQKKEKERKREKKKEKKNVDRKKSDKSDTRSSRDLKLSSKKYNEHDMKEVISFINKHIPQIDHASIEKRYFLKNKGVSHIDDKYTQEFNDVFELAYNKFGNIIFEIQGDEYDWGTRFVDWMSADDVQNRSSSKSDEEELDEQEKKDEVKEDENEYKNHEEEELDERTKKFDYNNDADPEDDESWKKKEISEIRRFFKTNSSNIEHALDEFGIMSLKMYRESLDAKKSSNKEILKILNSLND